MKLSEIENYLEHNVILVDEKGQTFSGFLTNYIAELDDDDNLVELVDLIPEDGSRLKYRYDFNIKQIKKIQLR